MIKQVKLSIEAEKSGYELHENPCQCHVCEGVLPWRGSFNLIRNGHLVIDLIPSSLKGWYIGEHIPGCMGHYDLRWERHVAEYVSSKSFRRVPFEEHWECYQRAIENEKWLKENFKIGYYVKYYFCGEERKGRIDSYDPDHEFYWLETGVNMGGGSYWSSYPFHIVKEEFKLIPKPEHVKRNWPSDPDYVV